MLQRLELLIVNDSPAQKGGFILLLVLSLLPVDLGGTLYTDVLSLEVITPAAVVVFAVFLVTLDSYQQAHRQVRPLTIAADA